MVSRESESIQSRFAGLSGGGAKRILPARPWAGWRPGRLACALIAALEIAVLLGGCVGHPPSGQQAGTAEDASSQAWKDGLWSHLPPALLQASGSRLHGLDPFLSPPGSTPGVPVPPSGLTDLLSRAEGPAFERLPLPPPPPGREPLLSALATYAATVDAPLPETAVLRQEIRSLGVGRAGQDALAQLVLAYAQALQLQGEAAARLTPDERLLLGSDPQAVSAWFQQDPGRTPDDLLAQQASIAASKLDFPKTLQATDLLARAVDAVRAVLGPGGSEPAAPAPRHAALGTGDAWSDLDALVAGVAGPPRSKATLGDPTLAEALESLREAYGMPSGAAVDLPAFPPSLADALALLVQAQADGLRSDPATHAHLLLEASRRATPVLQHWGAILKGDGSGPEGSAAPAGSEAAGDPGAVPSPHGSADAPDLPVQDPTPSLFSKLSGGRQEIDICADGPCTPATPCDTTPLFQGNANCVSKCASTSAPCVLPPCTPTDTSCLFSCPSGDASCVPLLTVGSALPNEYGHPAVILVDLGGDDHYSDVVAGDVTLMVNGNPTPTGSFSLDVDGSDHYDSPASGKGTQGYAAVATPFRGDPSNERSSQEVSMLVDVQGDDTYTTTIPGQGAGQGGYGFLLDMAGNDHYTGGAKSQGYGAADLLRFFGSQSTPVSGAGALIDLLGDDTYTYDTQGLASGGSAALLYDGSGTDEYHGTDLGTYLLNPNNLSPSTPNNAFSSQGHVVDTGVGVFIDSGSARDNYTAIDTRGIDHDLGAIKNDVGLRFGSGSGSPSLGAFSDNALSLKDDADGDGSSNLVELLAGTNPYDPASNPGSVFKTPDPNNPPPIPPDPDNLPVGGGQGPVLDVSQPGGGANPGIALPGLVIGGSGNSTYTTYVPFLVDLGGNDTYTAPHTGGSFLVGSSFTSGDAWTSQTAFTSFTSGAGPRIPNLGSVVLLLDLGGSDTYAPDPAGCDRNDSYTAGPQTQFQTCASLGGALSGIAILADYGKAMDHNHFETTFTNTATLTSSNPSNLAASSLGVTQGAALPGAVGILATWNSSNDFGLRMQTNAQLNAPTIATALRASSYGLAQGSSIAGVGVLASFGGGNDTYTVDTEGQGCVRQQPCTNPKTSVVLHDMAQGFTEGGLGVLFDGGGANLYQAPHGFAQGSSRSLLGERYSPVDFASNPCTNGCVTQAKNGVTLGGMAFLWSGAGDDRYIGGVLSQGAGGTVNSTSIKAGGGAVSAASSAGATGLLLDEGGNDAYRIAMPGPTSDFLPNQACAGCLISQGAAFGTADANLGVNDGYGLLVDLAGDDRYQAVGGSVVQAAGVGAGLGMLLDFGGNDVYRALNKAQSYAEGTAGQALLLDVQGQDTYVLDKSSSAAGQGSTPDAFFLDAQGKDIYIDSGDTTHQHKDSSTWNGQEGEDRNELDGAFAGLGTVTLTLKDPQGRVVNSGNTTEGNLTLIATLSIPDNYPVTVNRADFLMVRPDGTREVVGRGQGPAGGPYSFTWVTQPASDVPWAPSFKDGAYTLQASVFVTPVDKSVQPNPDLASVQSSPAQAITLDNPPLVASSLDKTLASPSAGAPPNLLLSLGPDQGYPNGFTPAAGNTPGATVNVTARRGSDTPITLFPTQYVYAGNATIPLVLSSSPDGGYDLTVTVTDSNSHVVADTHNKLILDGTRPVSRIDGFPKGVAGLASFAGGGLQFHANATDDPLNVGADGVAGVAQVLLLRQNGTGVWEPVADSTAPPFAFTVPGVSDGDRLTLLTVSVDGLGNEESPCQTAEARIPVSGLPAGLSGLCYKTKADNPLNVTTVLLDLFPPDIGKLTISPLVIKPGAPVTFSVPVRAAHPENATAGALTVRIQFSDGLITAALPQVGKGVCGLGAQSPFSCFQYADPGVPGSTHLDLHSSDRNGILYSGNIIAVDGGLNPNSASFTAFIDGNAPQVTVSPAVYTLGQKQYSAGQAGAVASLGVVAEDMPHNVTSVAADLSKLGLGSSVPMKQDSGNEQHWTLNVTLTAAMKDGTYPVPLVITDLAGNVAYASATIEVSSGRPEISNVMVTDTQHDNFTVQWTTSKGATAQVLYGKTGNLGKATDEIATLPLPTSHTVKVTGLSPGTTYYYRVVSRSASGVENDVASEPLRTIRTHNAYTTKVPDPDGQSWRGVHPVVINMTFVPGTATDPVHVAVRLQDSDKSSSPQPVADFDMTPGNVTVPIDTGNFGDGMYLLNVTANRLGDTFTSESHAFRIDNNPPVLTPVFPLPAATVHGAQPTLRVAVLDPSGANGGQPSVRTVTLTVDGAAVPLTPCPDAGFNVCYTGTPARLNLTLPTLLSDGIHTANVTATDTSGNTGSVQWSFRVDTSGPGIQNLAVTYLPGPVAAKPGGTVKVTADLSDAGIVASARLGLASLGGTSTPLLSMGGGHWQGSFKVPANAAAGNATITVVATDDMGNNATAASFAIPIDTQPPVLSGAQAAAIDFTHARLNVSSNEPTTLLVFVDGVAAPASDGVFSTHHSLVLENLHPNHTYALTVRGVDGAGLSTNTTVAAATVADAVPPGMPGQLTVASTREGVAELAWLPAGDNVGIDHYSVSRLSAGVRIPVASVPGNQTGLSDEAAPAGQEATYLVGAVDLAGNAGPEASVTVVVLALPHLENGTVTPDRGTADTPFTFTVDYRHAGGRLPALLEVRSGTLAVTMAPISSASACSVVCHYQAQVRLPPTSQLGPRSIVFHAEVDGRSVELALDHPPTVLSGRGAAAHTLGPGQSAPSPAIVFLIAALGLAAMARRRRDA